MNTTTTGERETRPYPYDCRSAYCARTDCQGCPMLPALNEFKAWCKARAAVVLDENWAPCTYTATR
jgi:hypothetical protein